MAERRVLCGGLVANKADSDRVIHLDTQAIEASLDKVNLQIRDISTRMVQNVPEVLTDLLEIAAYVYCADQFTKRGTDMMRNMGAEWRRKFDFHIPVRQPDIWSSAPVLDALTDTLGFLSEDEYRFEFVPYSNPPTIQPYLEFGEPSSARGFQPDEVVLFSGGLDSFAGAVEHLIGAGRNVALVSHQSSTMVASRQTTLVDALRQRTRACQLFHVPLVVNKNHERGCEYTQRTRSFLFAALGAVVAALFGRKRILFFENGIVSLNFPTAEHVLGARATRTTHPRVLEGFSRLFSNVLEDTVAVENPYFWKTKSEVVQVIADHDCAELISETFSCTRVRTATRIGKHCGVCSQCVDRRFGILGAGLGEYEPADRYHVDFFTGNRKPGSELTMAETYVLAANKLAGMSEMAFLAAYGQTFRVLRHLPGTPDENAKRIYELHKRHANTVCDVVDRAIQDHASGLRQHTLPDTCLLSLVISRFAADRGHKDLMELAAKPSEQAAADQTRYVKRPIIFTIDDERQTARFLGGVTITGANYKLIKALAGQFQSDVEKRANKLSFEYVKKERLMKALGITEHTLRQQVRRCRKTLAAEFKEKLGCMLDDDDVIQNQEWRGYRLNPSLFLVAPAQLPPETTSTRDVTLSPTDVTTLPAE
ncbi:MAG: 7-cyano-7-deazaguanine synthase [Rhodospirillales bacterium]|nr:7-cyano-7-deazaguanine synthase [Rhodospirillales bacterium]